MILTDTIGQVRSFRMARDFMGRGLYFTAAYLVDGLMVDTGCSYTVSELVERVADSPPEVIVNTHSHEDHVAANAALLARFGAEIMAHPLALPVLRYPRAQNLRPYQRVMWGYPAPSTALPVPDFVETADHCFNVIHTPGHSPDHVCLFEPHQGWLFVGDAYVGGRDRALRADYNIWDIIASLQKLLSLQPQTLFPGSGNVRTNAAPALREKIDYLQETGYAVLRLRNRGWGLRRIRRKLFGPEMPIAYLTLGHFSGRNLLRSYVEDAPSGP
ncbi:MBL fold metallo-hydrolase [Thermodesulfobacteriota bacterium]